MNILLNAGQGVITMTNKTYSTSVYCGMVNGKQITKHIRAYSQRELKQKVAELKAEISSNKNVYDTAIFGEWADKWIKEKIIGNVSNGTLTEYKAAIKHLKAYFDKVCMRDIRFSDFQQFINTLAKENPNTKKPMSKKTLGDLKKVASAIFDYAIQNNISGISNYFKGIIIPKNAPQLKRRALSESEQQMIIDTPHAAQLPAMIMMFSGLRRGEVIPLMWSDIDFERNIITVNKSVNFEINSAIVKDGGKTENAKRIVPLSPILKDYLLKKKKSMTVLSMTVCVNSKGKMHTESSWRRMWESYLLDLNIKYGYKDIEISKHSPTLKAKTLPMKILPFTPHYLRHTFATMLYLQGVDLETAKHYLGHGDIAVTSNIYTHCDESINKNLLSDEYKMKLKQEYRIIA